ncbi:MAG: hypothetical protein ABL973_20845 [Micropepsaceae bacterium]
MPTLGEYSEVAICNMALAEIGRGAEITSLDEAGQAARACRRRYPYARDAALRGYDWNFAARRAALPASSMTPLFGYASAFGLPADCLLVRRVNHCSAQRWEVEGRQILTDATAPLSITYTARITDPGLFDALFVDALATRLAADLCVQLSENTSRAQILFQLYQNKIAEARIRDAQEGDADHDMRSAWLDARFERGFVLQPGDEW